jgi:cytochrome b subunit of formate dehydrogenase
VRLGAVVHAAIAAIMIAMIFVHVYAALWVRGTVRAMVYGTVTRAWAKQHHRAWYRQVTGKSTHKRYGLFRPAPTRPAGFGPRVVCSPQSTRLPSP